MTINGITVNVNAASSLLTSYLIEVEKIAKKVNLSVENVDMIIRLNRSNLHFQEVVLLDKATEGPVEVEVKENEPALVVAKNNVFDLEYIASHKEAYEMIDVSKPVCLDNVKVRKADVCNTFKMVLAGLRKIGVKEVHYRYWCEPSEGIAALAKQSAMAVTEGKRSEEQKRRYFYYKDMAAKKAQAQQQPQEVPMPEEPKKGRYMSAANMASLEASAPARAFNKDAIKAAAQRLAASRANKPATAPAQAQAPTPAPAPEQAPTPVKEEKSVEEYAREILVEAGYDEWDIEDTMDYFGGKNPDDEEEPTLETATVVAPAPAPVATPEPAAAVPAVAQSSFIVPSFDEMMGFCSTVSTYVEKDGETVVDDGKDNEEELTDDKREELLAGVSLNGYSEEAPKKIEDIPEMDASEFEKEYNKMHKWIEKGNALTPYHEALFKEAEENRDCHFVRNEKSILVAMEEGRDYTEMLSPRTRAIIGR